MQNFKQKELEATIIKDNLIIESLEQWVLISHEGKDLAQLFREMGYKTIAIYGYGHLGRLLEKILKNSDIRIACVMDIMHENTEGYYIRPNSICRGIDVIIVTSSFYYEDIRNQMQNEGCETEIRLLDEFLFQL